MVRVGALFFLVSTLVLTPAVAAGEIPPSLRDLVLGAGHRSVVETRLDGSRFEGLAPFSNRPYVLWPSGAADVPRDHDGAAGWIRRSSVALGHRDFVPRYLETSGWHGNEVWTYELLRRGIVLYDARVSLHWQGENLVGIVNHVPLPILQIQEPTPDEIASGERVYVARRAAGGHALELARELRETSGDRVTISLVLGDETVRRIVVPAQPSGVPAAPFYEWSVPSGDFPDQIDIDSSGLVWFSQPNQDSVTSFDPTTHVFTQHASPVGSGPDGMMLDSNDVLWTGLYFLDSGLGRFDVATSIFTAFEPPHLPAALAVPNETSGGTLWVTDHENNRIAEFDPTPGSWVQSLEMPTPNCWVVGGTEDSVALDVYFTEYNADQLGKKALGGPITDIAAPPGSGPAFAVYSDGFVYFTEWNEDRLGAYEISTDTVTEYAYPVAGELGGPLDVTPGGLIAVGTRNVGYVMVFDPAATSFTAYKIPTEFPGLKDGLRSDDNGLIWVAESAADKIAVLDLPGVLPATDFSAQLTGGTTPLSVEFTDASTNSPTTWSWGFGDSGVSNDPNPTHVYTETGLYTVSLTAANEFGGTTQTKVGYVNVIDPCPLAAQDVVIAGRREDLNAGFNWGGSPECRWAIHRATAAEKILSTPPVEIVIGPMYVDVAPPEPLVFYNIEPIDNLP